MLGADCFVVPLMPDAFSVQGIQNLGSIFAEWKEQWKVTAKALAGDIESKFILDGEGLFIGYIVNSYNVYADRPIKKQAKFIDLLPDRVKTHLSERHSRNGLVAKSYEQPLQNIQDYGQLPPIGQEKLTAIFNIPIQDIVKLPPGSSENYEKSKVEFTDLAKNILSILGEY